MSRRRTKTGFTLSWDYENRLTSITGTPSASYAYDYSGRRASKTAGGTATSYLYDGLNLISETSAGTTTDHLFGPGLDEPLASSRAGSVVYEAVDGLASIALTRDAAGVAQNSYVFDAWGSTRSNTFAQPFRYAARELGDVSDLFFYRARYYAPSAGRFLSEDSLRFVAGPNFYTYTSNSPTLFNDPEGLCPSRVWAFMLPLVAFPAALALARLTFGQRLLIHASLLLVTVALYTNMRFIVMLT